ncbi:two-component regulator propeller domain-containing protein [Mucilaginibacter terrae]|uniref:histidine kinase n=1 Tax=Mucilaginibacter terrae TaxID=1955052 RepID=A0ABU3GR69_9SPHI|nr:two-component regulator propeller domain-containing protein [Mucilaginibacter terrae]MDT3402130.1 signal transduction histidine kinase/ligand-binding sensor domain-containing protein/DNA-binding response OmpR family regulator [Mucilaginibacter terrae]
MIKRSKTYNICYCLFAGIILAFTSVYAQPKYNLKHYTTTDGLSHDRISCIAKDREGFMWFGTWDGLNRFDGYNFVSYKGRAGDSSNLENNKIRLINEDKQGYLWVKTFDNKIYRFDKKTEGFLAIQGKEAPQFIKNVLVDRIVPISNGDVWLLSQKQGALCAYAQTSGRGVPVIKAYTDKGKFRIANNQIKFLLEDYLNNIWIGTQAGINCLRKTASGDYESVDFKNTRSVLNASYSFTCIKQYGNLLYIGTQQGVVFVYDPARQSVKTLNIVPGTTINALVVDKQKIYLTTKGKGLVEYDQSAQQVKHYLQEFASLKRLSQDSHGLLWIEPSNGVIKFDPVKQTHKLFTQKKDAEALTIHTTFQIFEDAYGVLWACMAGGGFGYYDRTADQLNYFHNEPGTPVQQFSNVITAMYPDPTGVLWFSGYDRGINKVVLHPDVFKHEVIDNSASAKTVNEVRALCQDHAGRLWVGTKAGQVILYKNGIKLGNPFVNLQPQELGKVYSIYEAKNHTIWLGTKGNGLIEATPIPGDPQHYKAVKHVADAANPNSINSNMVYTIMEDLRGRIWIGTFAGGLNLLVRQGNTTIFKNQHNSFKNYASARANGVRHLQEDAKGNIWMATTNGLVIFNPDEGIDQFKFHRYTKVRGDETSLGGNDVQYILRDKSNVMWLGIFGGGLQKAITNFDLTQKIHFKVYTMANGLPNDIILSMVNDNQNRLWIATENGLSEFNPATEAFKNYNTDDGLPPAQFSESAFVKTADGNLVLGCTKGFVSFNPVRISSRKQYANIAFTNFQVSNKTITPGGADSILQYAIDQTPQITLKHNQNLFNIDYTALNYKIGHKVWYAYKLEGFDKQWNHVKNTRQATYTNVPPGTYTFTVRTTSNYLFKNNPSKSITITILPPWWKTWWAYLIYVILVIAALEVARRIIFTMIRLKHRVAVERKIAEMKVDFFTNISHELRTPLTLIVNPLKQISQNEELSVKGREHINLANKNADRMVRFINQLLDFRKLQSGKTRLKIAETDIIALVKNTTSYFTEVAIENHINFSFKANVESIYASVDEEKIDIVIYNLLANAFKYTSANKSIMVSVCARDSDIEIKVIDEGIGVPEDKLKEIFELYYTSSNKKVTKGTGIGLAFSKELIDAHHGDITAANNAIGGMTFTVQLKAGKNHYLNDEVDFVAPLQTEVARVEQVNEIENIRPELTVIDYNAEKPLVLIVEDNSELRKFLGEQLSVYYRVEMAADGAIGVQKAIELVPELIISDVMMPNMDGIAMLDALKQHMNTSHIPVVLLTAKSSVENQMEGMRYGADFYVTKPFNTEYVLVLVESLIKQRKQLFNNLLGSKNLVQLSPGEILITSKDEQLLKQVMETVETGMTDPDFNIDDVASGIGLGRTTFYKKLKSLTGLAPVEFVKEMRLKRGKQLIDSGEYNISEISYMVGFSSSGYFSTCFKEKYGQSPSQYLKSLKEIHS